MASQNNVNILLKYDVKFYNKLKIQKSKTNENDLNK